MASKIQEVHKLKLTGPFGHFRKFYTNSSSLSYLIPPRTVVAGLLASILKIGRHQYYELMDPNNCAISVQVGSAIKKQTQSMNYLHTDYYNLIAKGSKRGQVQHSQCKLELLIGESGSLEYLIYFGIRQGNKEYDRLIKSIQSDNFGYGIYLGQRQFKAHLEHLEHYDRPEPLEKSTVLDSCCPKDSVIKLETSQNVDIIEDKMPVNFKKETKRGTRVRLPTGINSFIFEKEGKPIQGEFENCYQIGDKIVKFY